MFLNRADFPLSSGAPALLLGVAFLLGLAPTAGAGTVFPLLVLGWGIWEFIHGKKTLDPAELALGGLLCVGLLSLGRVVDVSSAVRQLTGMGLALSFYRLLREAPNPKTRFLFRQCVHVFGGVISGWAAASRWGGGPPFFWPDQPQYQAFVVAVSFVLSLEGLREGGWKKPYPLILTGVTGVGLLLLPSRSGLLAAAAGTVFWVGGRWGARKVLALLFLGAAGAIFLSEETWEHVLKMSDAISFRRTDIWVSALQGLRSAPWLGWGPGQFGMLYQHHAAPQDLGLVRMTIFTSYAHNDFLQLATEYGIPLTLGAMGLFFWGGWRGRKEGTVLGERAAMGAVVVFCLFNYPLSLPFNALLASGLAALGCRGGGEILWSSRAKGVFRRGIAVSLVGVAVLSALLLMGILFRNIGPEVWAARFPPWDAEYLLDRAEARMHGPTEPAGSPSSIESDLREALRRFPGSPRGALLLIHWALEHKTPPDLKTAQETCQTAVSHFPTNAILHLKKGRVLFLAGEREAARASVHRALRLEPHFRDAALLLGEILRREGRPEQAERWLARTLSVAARPLPWTSAPPYPTAILRFRREEFLTQLARCQLDQGKNTEALSTLRSFPQGSSEMFSLAAEAARRLGRTAEADRWGRLSQSLRAGETREE